MGSIQEEVMPHVLTDDEIEFYMKGDRREIDRLILRSINKLTGSLIPHTRREEDRERREEMMLLTLGGIKMIEERAKFVDSLIERQGVRNKMMEKVSSSTVIWAFLAFCAFLAASVWDSLIAAIKLKIGG